MKKIYIALFLFFTIMCVLCIEVRAEEYEFVYVKCCYGTGNYKLEVTYRSDLDSLKYTKVKIPSNIDSYATYSLGDITFSKDDLYDSSGNIKCPNVNVKSKGQQVNSRSWAYKVYFSVSDSGSYTALDTSRFVQVSLKDNVCNKESSNYDEESCGELMDSLKGAECNRFNSLYSKESCEKYIDSLYETELSETPSPTQSTCESLLGNPNDDGTPAYYLQIVFNVMKYVGIVLLIVTSSLDFFGAIASQEDGAMKKVANKCLKRLIYCAIIFFVPVLLNYIFVLFNIYSSGTCGIS